MTLLPGKNKHFDLHPSRFFMGVLLLIHIGAMMAVLALPLRWWAYILIALVLLFSLVYYIEKYVYLGLAKAIRSLKTDDGRSWQLVQQNKCAVSGSLLGDSIVTPYLLILNFSVTSDAKRSRKRSVIIFKDALEANDFKQLRLLCLAQKG